MSAEKYLSTFFMPNEGYLYNIIITAGLTFSVYTCFILVQSYMFQYLNFYFNDAVLVHLQAKGNIRRAGTPVGGKSHVWWLGKCALIN